MIKQFHNMHKNISDINELMLQMSSEYRYDLINFHEVKPNMVGT